MEKFDACIVGAGVVGLAIARALSLKANLNSERIVIIDSHSKFGQGTSSRNSEVIHAGIYYQPDSLKARLCIRGKALLYEYLSHYEIGHLRCGKLIVAQRGQEEALTALFDNARASGLKDLELLNKSQLRLKEKDVTACSAIYSPSTGIIDSHHYMHCLLDQAQQQGVVFAGNSEVVSILPAEKGFEVQLAAEKNGCSGPDGYRFQTNVLINSAGLSSTDIANNIKGLPKECIPKLWLCKGDYFAYTGKNPFHHLIYPVPQMNTVGLGIHCTMDLGGQLKFGPDAYYVHEEDYDVNSSKAQDFAAAVQRYYPGLVGGKLQPSYSGIRPKLTGPNEPARDFMFQTQKDHGIEGLIQLFGIESPGLTASLAIADHVTELLGL